ncbi:hypothetical protein EG68_00785 [Paragonimus skrjabini miyazakii]|uniref:Uncharacterized protein n=1 Tax=Paragonimus skrjabini miyazakii TaxID=59628 RepID=A0A8S9Z8R4_9TREM|nr:hypothetical protein EG68_00785 [Paragonimus skrjabini miyazakii]
MNARFSSLKKMFADVSLGTTLEDLLMFGDFSFRDSVVHMGRKIRWLEIMRYLNAIAYVTLHIITTEFHFYEVDANTL